MRNVFNAEYENNQNIKQRKIIKVEHTIDMSQFSNN